MIKQEMQARIKEYKELQRMNEELKKEMEAIKDEIIDEMILNGTDEIIIGEYKIHWKPVKTSRFNTTEFKNVHHDLYKQFMQTSSTRRFSIA